MNDIFILVEGVPVAKGRPRVTTRGGFARAYTPAKTRAYESLVAEEGKEAMKELCLDPLETALHVQVNCYMPIPKSTSKKIRVKMLDGDIRHTKKPDVDNLAKCFDGLNGIAWLDDSQIVRLTATKQYSDYPRVEIFIKEMK